MPATHFVYLSAPDECVVRLGAGRLSTMPRAANPIAEAPLPDRRVTPVRFAAVADVAG